MSPAERIEDLLDQRLALFRRYGTVLDLIRSDVEKEDAEALELHVAMEAELLQACEDNRRCTESFRKISGVSGRNDGTDGSGESAEASCREFYPVLQQKRGAVLDALGRKRRLLETRLKNWKIPRKMGRSYQQNVPSLIDIDV